MDNLNYVFYHIPKTGGTSIFNITQSWKFHKRADRKHNHVRIIKVTPDESEGPVIAYAVTRCPYSRFASAFYHIVDSCNENFYYKNAKVSDCDWLQNKGIDKKLYVFNNDPNVFLHYLIDKKSEFHNLARVIYYHFDIFKSQFYWVGDPKTMKIHHSIKFLLDQKNLEDEFEIYVAKPLNEKAEWPRDKSSNKRITQDFIPLTYYSKLSIQKLYPYDFETFGNQR